MFPFNLHLIVILVDFRWFSWISPWNPPIYQGRSMIFPLTFKGPRGLHHILPSSRCGDAAVEPQLAALLHTHLRQRRRSKQALPHGQGQVQRLRERQGLATKIHKAMATGIYCTHTYIYMDIPIMCVLIISMTICIILYGMYVFHTFSWLFW